MKRIFKQIVIGLALFVTTNIAFTNAAHSEEIYRIEIGKKNGRTSNSELERRVWMLERAVWQLQQRVFELETTKKIEVPKETWICTLEAMGETYSATGNTMAKAKSKVINNCKVARDGNGFFCKAPVCEQ